MLNRHRPLRAIAVVAAVSALAAGGAAPRARAARLATGAEEAAAAPPILADRAGAITKSALPAPAGLRALTGGIAFTSDRNRDAAIFEQNADGSGDAALLVGGAGRNRMPSWSPDGQYLVFTSDRDGNAELYVRGAEGGDRRLTNDPASDLDPTWSPDGQRVLFSSTRGSGNYALYTMNRDGTDVKRLLGVAGQNLLGARWSPDGQRIAYMQASTLEPQCRWNWDVWLVGADGAGARRLTTQYLGDVYPNWTPEGDIVFSSCGVLSDFDLHAVDPDTGVRRQLTDWEGREYGAIYAPDATGIAFSHGAGSGDDEVWVAPLDGDRLAYNLTANPAIDLAGSWRRAAAPVVPAANVAVLVHGIGLFDLKRIADLFADDCPAAPAAYTGSPDQFGGLATYLHESGYQVYLARYPTSPLGTASLGTAAACLEQQIGWARRRHGVSQVTLVAHSMGGIVSRRYIEGSGYAGDVAALVTYGSPHHGIYETARTLALLFPGARSVVANGQIVVCVFHPGLCELDPSLMALYNWRHKPLPSVRYHAIGGTRGWALSGLIPGADDGLIAQESASALKIGERDRASLWSWEVPESHGAEVSPAYYFAPVGESRSCLAALLRDDGAGGGCRRAIRSSAAAGGAVVPGPDPAMEARAYTRLVSGAVAASAAVTMTTEIDGAEALLPVGYSGGPLDYSLVAPGGAVVDPSTVARLYPGSEYSSERDPDGSGGIALYRIASPRSGTWEIRLRNLGATELSYATFAALESAIQLGVAVPAATYPGAAVQLRADLMDGGRPIRGARVEAAYHTASGEQIVWLEEAGDGRYLGLAAAPGEPGPYQVTIRASGSAASGAAFEREALAVMDVDRRLVPTIYLPSTER